MDPISLLAVINASLGLVESLAPEFGRLVKSGEISVAEQEEVRKRYQALRDGLKEHFAGPEWEA